MDLNEELAKEVTQLDDEVDRFGFYIVRQLKAAVENEAVLKSIGLSSPRACLDYRVIVKFVERIAENTLLLGKRPGKAFLANLHEMAIHSKKICSTTP